MISRSAAATSSAVATLRAPGARPRATRAVGCALIAWDIVGWVNLGSSPSLWPCRRYPTRSIRKSLWKRVAVGDADADRDDARLSVVGVDVNDRDVEALGDVARIVRRARIIRDRS